MKTIFILLEFLRDLIFLKKPDLISKTAISLSSDDLGDPQGPPVENKLKECFLLNDPLDERSDWCWAVVAEGVSQYYAKHYGSKSFCQCAIAKALIGPHCCDGHYGNCNQTALLDAVLDITGNLREPIYSPFIGFDKIGQEMAADRPLGIRLCRNGGHFVVIIETGMVGVQPYEQVTYKDPAAKGRRYLPYEKLKDEWTHTYYTSPGHKGERNGNYSPDRCPG